MNNNPFSKDINSKRMFDWTFEMSAKQNEEFSLQRYKELFLYFVNCFRSGKIEMLEKELFDENWDRDYNNSIGCKVFHLAVNCYLYYIGYRESDDCVEKEQKQTAQKLLQRIISKNTQYYRFLYIEDIKESQIQFFLREIEIMPKKEIGKIMILPDICREFYVFSVLFAACYKTVDIGNIIKQNEQIYSYRVFLSKEQEEKKLFATFMSVYCVEKNLKIEELYAVLKNTLRPIFNELKIEESKRFIEKYNSEISEEVLGNLYKNQIQEFLNNSFAAFSKAKENVITLKNQEILTSRILTNFIDNNIGQTALDAILFNIVIQIQELLKAEKAITIEYNFDKSDVKNYLDYLTTNSLDFIIGSPDVIAPRDYKQYDLIQRFENDFKHLYLLGWFRHILALNSEALSISITNINADFSIPTIEEMQDEYEKTEEGLYKKKSEIEKFTKDEFMQIIENTYRNITVTADISVGLNADRVGVFIVPKVAE